MIYRHLRSVVSLEKVTDFFRRLKIPLHLRASIPLIVFRPAMSKSTQVSLFFNDIGNIMQVNVFLF